MGTAQEEARQILSNSLRRVEADLSTKIIEDSDISERISIVALSFQNRATVRLLLSCALAKIHNPKIDIRKPYTEIGTADSFSGRTYDEQFLTQFIFENELPCNTTTAFLTPALRNITHTLTPDLDLAGRPPIVYKSALQLLTDVHTGKISAEELLSETLRFLILSRNEKQQRMASLLEGLKPVEGVIPLSSEEIVGLIEQHLRQKGASRLPVLVVAAAYEAGGAMLGERALPLESHNAADKQTGSVGDVEVTLIGDNNVVTGYEMKLKKVTRDDIDIALGKIIEKRIDNYIFITTDTIDISVKEYAASLYEKTGGVEIVVLDCVGFIRHFLHLFHRKRSAFIEAYQILVLSQPNSSVGQPLKELWLAMRQAAETRQE